MARLMENLLSFGIIGVFLAAGVFLFHGVSPDKLKSALIGVLAGLVAGTFCLFAANTDDPRVQYDRDVAAYKLKLQQLTSASGYLEPHAASQTPTPPRKPDVHAGSVFTSAPLVIVYLPALYLLFFHGAAIVRGAHYVLVPHAADSVVRTALRDEISINRAQFSAAMRIDRGIFTLPAMPFIARNQAARARALKDKLEADAALARSAVNRERARAAAKEQVS